MPELDDIALLWQYAEDNSESAFAALAEKYVNLLVGRGADEPVEVRLPNRRLRRTGAPISDQTGFGSLPPGRVGDRRSDTFVLSRIPHLSFPLCVLGSLAV